MKLFFLRHGIAAEQGQWSERDFDRPLTSDGIARMEREAKGIAALSLGIDAVVTSPLVRSRQTAEIVADRLDLRGALVEDERLGAAFSFELLPAILADHPGDAVLLVGHEPGFSVTLGRLVGGAHVEVKKGALAGVELAPSGSPRGMLVCLIPPKALRR